MAMSGESVKIAGLKDLVRELKKLDDRSLTDGLKDAGFEVAGLVTRDAQSNAAGLGRMESRAAATLKPGRRVSGAVVSGGGNAAPWFAGAEFGAGRDVPRQTKRGPVRGWNQFQPWKGSGGDAGYFLHPAIRDAKERTVDIYGDAIEKITKSAFPD